MPEKKRVKSTRIRYIKYIRQNKRIKKELNLISQEYIIINASLSVVINEIKDTKIYKTLVYVYCLFHSTCMHRSTCSLLK